MATKLQDFREQYPQYNDLDDEALAEKIRLRHYSELEVGDYRTRMGLAPLPEPERAPTIRERINKTLFDRGKKVDPLTAPTPRAPQYLDPDGFEVDTTRPIIQNIASDPNDSVAVGFVLPVSFSLPHIRATTIDAPTRASTIAARNPKASFRYSLGIPTMAGPLRRMVGPSHSPLVTFSRH